jgi:hypothetical protein
MENYEKARDLAYEHVKVNLFLTMNEALKENPELLFEANNYEKNKEKLNIDNKDRDSWDEPEVYEFWAVDEWLYDKLTEKGEITFEYLDFYIWGRQTTGQAIYLDEVIQEIANE